jgi:cation diffusion facilitator CzcD-associated flavoprotein CzcO
LVLHLNCFFLGNGLIYLRNFQSGNGKNLIEVREMKSVKALEVAVIGTGFSGLGMAIRLKKDGVEDFAVFEKAADVGGTWRENTYPGCACDVPSHLYSFSFEQNPDWTRAFATQPEIHAYLKDVTRKHDLLPHIRYGHQLTAASFDDELCQWNLSFANGNEVLAKNVVLGIGGLHIPQLPKFDGADDFTGPAFHSAEWNHDIDLTGKKVAVIGTGASAIQIIPAIADKVEKLYSFQRTAPWVMPKPDREYSEREKALFAKVPFVQNLSRDLIYNQHEVRFVAFRYAKPLLKGMELVARHNINKSIKNRVLRRKVTPLFDMGCKRVLISNDYYPALAKPNVDVVTARIDQVTETGIKDSGGKQYDVDVIIYATGFKTVDAIANMNFSGRNGLKIQDAWKAGAESYMGIHTAGFPNAYFLMGPNTGLGHNSMVYMIESQIQYVADALKQARKNQWSLVDVKPEAQRHFVGRIQGAMKNTVWASGCQSWYLDDQGKNWTLWPGFTFAYRAMTRRFDPAVCEVKTSAESPKKTVSIPKRNRLARLTGSLLSAA